jgi:hypothetical protein
MANWTSYAETAKRGGGQQTVIGPDEVQLRYHQPKTGSPRLIVRVGNNLLSQAKIKIKDKVDILTNVEGQVLLRKEPKGWTVYPVNGSGGGVNFIWKEDRRLFTFEAKTFTKVEAKVDKDGIVFDIPQQETE